tara:strand:+ start:74 stop:616 length:543 start_codon:yes stop_codon:yes gene_type:complete
MKKHLIFSVIGGLIFFVWGFISWAGANLHEEEQTYTPLESEVLSAIASTGLKTGMYALGQGDKTLGMDAQWNDWVANFKGKPWGRLNYQPNMQVTMEMNLFRSFTKCLVIAAILNAILGMINTPVMKTTITFCVAIGFMGFMSEFYTSYIWYKTPGIYAHILDATVPWELVGVLAGKMKI